MDTTQLAALGLAELRMLRTDALEQEADLSYLRRLLQGRVDILRAELDRRTLARQPPRRPRRCCTGCRRSSRTPPRPCASRPGTSPWAPRAVSSTRSRRTP